MRSRVRERRTHGSVRGLRREPLVYSTVYDGRLNMERILEKFVEHFNDIYGENNNKFVEDYGRKFFLLYLRPIIMSSLRYRIKGILIV